MTNEIDAILAELRRAVEKFPTWPTDPLHALAVLGEEFGETTKATLQAIYEPHKSTPADVRAEAIQTAAMAIRFLISLDAYRFEPGMQHIQSEARHALATPTDPQSPPPPGCSTGAGS